jgi:hypothetical protein
MRGVILLLLLGLAACVTADRVTPPGVSSELREWQTPKGKPPTRAEFAAVVAACRDREKSTDQTGPISGCLTDLGLRRVQ